MTDLERAPSRCAWGGGGGGMAPNADRGEVMVQAGATAKAASRGSKMADKHASARVQGRQGGGGDAASEDSRCRCSRAGGGRSRAGESGQGQGEAWWSRCRGAPIKTAIAMRLVSERWPTWCRVPGVPRRHSSSGRGRATSSSDQRRAPCTRAQGHGRGQERLRDALVSQGITAATMVVCRAPRSSRTASKATQ